MRLKFNFREDDAPAGEVAPLRREPAKSGVSVGFEPAAFEGGVSVDGLAHQFPMVRFAPLSGGVRAGHDVLILAADAERGGFEQALARTRELSPRTAVVVVLRGATVEKTRTLLREGAADVLTAPVSEPALAVSLERLIARLEPAGSSRGGEVVGLLKAGGGVGATSLGVQVGVLLAEAGVKVCFADLDVQFGSAAVYLDLQEATTLEDVLAAGQVLQELPFSTSLAAHRSGLRVLAAPKTVMALEALSPSVIDNLLSGLRREFDLVLVDLPTDWTAWTNRALRTADRLVMVAQLSVPHALLTKRQLQMLAMQQLEDRPLTVVCNQAAPDKIGGVSVSAVQRAVGRSFDLIVPEERRLMSDAINQGVTVGALRRGTKLEKALQDLAGHVWPALVEGRHERARR